MPKLNAADAIYMGGQAALKVMLGATKIWTPAPPEPVTGWFGTQATGANAASTDSDRAFLGRFTMPEPGTATMLWLWFAPGTTAGCSFKGLIYQEGAAYPSSRLSVGSPIAIPAGGGWVGSPIVAPLTSADYWAGGVFNSYEASLGFGSGGASTTIRLEGPGRDGTFSYTSPPTTAPAGGTGIYEGLTLPCYVEYTRP